MNETTLADLRVRVEELERKHFQCPKSVEFVDESMRRTRFHVESSVPPCTSAVYKFVPAHYTWAWEMTEKAVVKKGAAVLMAVALKAPSMDYLCKTLLMDNRTIPFDAHPHDPTNPKFVLVNLRYAAALDNQKLVNRIRALRPVGKRLDVTHFDFQIASEQDIEALTGFEHNTVTPFGLLHPEKVCMVLSATVASLPFFWIGGGHEHLKLRITTTEFCRALQPIVADINQLEVSEQLSLDLGDGVKQADEHLKRIMERRREEIDQGIDPMLRKDIESLKGGFRMSSEERREQAESSPMKQHIDPAVARDTTGLKNFAMSSDLKKVLARRRGLSGD